MPCTMDHGRRIYGIMGGLDGMHHAWMLHVDAAGHVIDAPAMLNNQRLGPP